MATKTKQQQRTYYFQRRHIESDLPESTQSRNLRAHIATLAILSPLAVVGTRLDQSVRQSERKPTK